MLLVKLASQPLRHVRARAHSIVRIRLISFRQRGHSDAAVRDCSTVSRPLGDRSKREKLRHIGSGTCSFAEIRDIKAIRVIGNAALEQIKWGPGP
jgi:hypothetical protein